MALVRWDPALEIDSMQADINRMFDQFFGGRQGNGSPRRWIPAIDLAETADELVLTADLPGLDEDDIAIEVKDNVMTISGERKDVRERKDRGYHRVERSFGTFTRSLTLPEGIDADKVTASFDRGVLEVKIPKPEQRKPHRVTIGTGGTETIEAEATEK